MTCNKYNLPEHMSFNSVVSCFRCTGIHSFITMSRLTLSYNHFNVFPTVSVFWEALASHFSLFSQLYVLLKVVSFYSLTKDMTGKVTFCVKMSCCCCCFCHAYGEFLLVNLRQFEVGYNNLLFSNSRKIFVPF